VNIKKERSVQLETLPAEVLKILEVASIDGVAAVADGSTVRYLVVDVDKNPVLDLTEDEKFEIVSKRIMNQHRRAFEELAK
jgi:antitoxin Phd